MLLVLAALPACLCVLLCIGEGDRKGVVVPVPDALNLSAVKPAVIERAVRSCTSRHLCATNDSDALLKGRLNELHQLLA